MRRPSKALAAHKLAHRFQRFAEPGSRATRALPASRPVHPPNHGEAPHRVLPAWHPGPPAGCTKELTVRLAFGERICAERARASQAVHQPTRMHKRAHRSGAAYASTVSGFVHQPLQLAWSERTQVHSPSCTKKLTVAARSAQIHSPKCTTKLTELHNGAHRTSRKCLSSHGILPA